MAGGALVDQQATKRQLEPLPTSTWATPARNYAGAIREVMAINRAAISVQHDPGRQLVQVGGAVSARARAVHPSAEAVICGIPGHERPGTELVHELLRVGDPRLEFEFDGRCGFATTFDYASG